jgi:cell wall-associated NlpC family hydrolase
MPSRAFLRASLALWRRRHDYRQARLDIAHAQNDKDRIDHWHDLLADAGRMIRLREAQLGSDPRAAIVAAAHRARANYLKNPGAYHYRAGGISNIIIMAPTPRTFRSDCSQFAVNVYRVAKVKCPGSGSYMFSNTGTIAGGGRITPSPRPGDLGMYCYDKSRPRSTTHHVEVYIGEPGCEFIGHGTQPIDSLTPGRPDYYLSFID